MKYLHRYNVEGTPIFVLSSSSTKPTGTYSIKQEDWRGRALGRFQTVVGQLEGLKFSKKDEPEVEETPEIKAKKASIVEALDKIASDVEAEGALNFALAIDRVSDFLESAGNK